MGSWYIFVCQFDVDVMAELGVWCDLCEKSSIGCRILRDFLMSLWDRPRIVIEVMIARGGV